ncbi:transporter associated domain-containing protein [Candidatus Pandoraea novymonadis]|uniref:Hemolysin C n=1 Tax=Candidatus Pandoraea novymonadis TaxID=1808959 RepID=A0ABX5FFD3_9BURK|nr:transporter associated domain-containing protein [Candidatus Pandoraea novymonadis]PSB92419.1 Hemolysin C [Candidatus Pandoraea novymonadis]
MALNTFVRALLKVFGIFKRKTITEAKISRDELHPVILKTSNYIQKKPSSLPLNLLDLKKITVEDVMVPRAHIEALDISAPLEELLQQLEICYHNKLPVYDTEIDNIVGILHIRCMLSVLRNSDNLTVDTLRNKLVEPYFIPSDTSALQQLQYFEENHRSVGLVVNEYGEVKGLITSEDIIKELISEFTNDLRIISNYNQSGWTLKGDCIINGAVSLRDINRQLGIQLSTKGPKTLNGLILETLREIPEACVSMEIDGCRMEIMKIDNQAIQTVRLFRPALKPIVQDH